MIHPHMWKGNKGMRRRFQIPENQKEEGGGNCTPHFLKRQELLTITFKDLLFFKKKKKSTT